MDCIPEVVKLLRESPKVVTQDQVVTAIQVLLVHYRGTQNRVEMRGVQGAPDWLGYEMRLWELSELVRAYLKAKRSIRGRCDVLDAVADIVGDQSLGKGRQNFVLVLGQYGGKVYADVLGKLLDDPEVLGHAVKALARLKEPGYSSRVKEILSATPIGWVKAAARRYLKAMQA